MLEILGEIFIEIILEGFFEVFSCGKIPLVFRIIFFSVYVLLFTAVVGVLVAVAVKENNSGIGILAIFLGVLFLASFIYIGKEMWRKEQIQ